MGKKRKSNITPAQELRRNRIRSLLNQLQTVKTQKQLTRTLATFGIEQGLRSQKVREYYRELLDAGLVEVIEAE